MCVPKPRRLPVVKTLAAVSKRALTARTKEERVYETGDTRADLNRSATSVIENTELECPSLGCPDPMNDRAVAASGRASE